MPAALYGVPFQVYGKADEQTVTLVVLVDVALIARFNVATESQPTEFTNVAV